MKLSLHKLKASDRELFSKWWRSRLLARLTSGVTKMPTDKEVATYFSAMLNSKKDLHYMIIAARQAIDHIALIQRRNGWYETQIIIGDRVNWGKGYGTKAIKQLLSKARRLRIKKYISRSGLRTRELFPPMKKAVLCLPRSKDIEKIAF